MVRQFVRGSAELLIPIDLNEGLYGVPVRQYITQYICYFLKIEFVRRGEIPLTIFMTKCVYCGLKSEEPKCYIRNFCDSCVKDKYEGSPNFHVTRTLSTGITISKAWEKETERRVVLPTERKDGGDHYVGRIWNNGKIEERTVDIR